MGFIYKITNKINDKVYIGKTIRTIKQRWYTHGNGSCHFHNAIKKYGRDNFIVKEIYESNDPWLLKQAEIASIEYYDTFRNGYNMTLGGEGGIPSDEVRAKLSHYASNRPFDHARKLKGRIVSEETRKKMSLAQQGHIPWNKGISHSEETKRKIAMTKIGKTLSEETKKKMSLAHKGYIPWNKGKSKYGS